MRSGRAIGHDLRRAFNEHSRLLIWGAAFGLFLVIMAVNRTGVGDPVIISSEHSDPLRRSAISFHPTVDVKRYILREMFDYRTPVEANFEAHLRGGNFVRAYQLAYLDSNYRHMMTVIVGLRSRLAGLRSGGEEAMWDISNLQLTMVDALDETLLFEAFAFERLGATAAAIQRYSQYVQLLKQLGPIQVDPFERNIDRRLSVVRIKLFILRRAAPARAAATPYLDGLTSSFLERLPRVSPYQAYFDGNILPAIPTRASRAAQLASAAPPSDAVGHLDFCLARFGPHRGRFPPSRWAAPCGAEFYAQRHGGFNLIVAILEYDRLQNRLDHIRAPEEPAISDEEVASAAAPAANPIRYDPLARQVLDATLEDATALIDRIPGEAPDAQFLIDDLVNDISEFILSSRAKLFPPAQIARGAHADLVRHVICDLAPISQRTVYVFDRREALLARLREVGRQCA